MLKLMRIYIPLSDIEKNIKIKTNGEYDNYSVANVTTDYNNREITFDVYVSDNGIEKDDRRYKFDVSELDKDK